MKERIKRSIVWSISTDEFKKLVKESQNIAQICRYFGLGIKGGNYGTIKRRIKQENIDMSHFHQKQSSKFNWISKEEFLSKILCYKDNNWIKKKIMEFDIIPQICKECGLKNHWNNKPLILHLDHISGNRNDNRIENLRFLCPNCHTQTETYSVGQRKIITYYCVDCKCEISKNQIRCRPCGNKTKRKVERPSAEELRQMISTMTFVDIGKKYNISDNAIRKWCKYYKLI